MLDENTGLPELPKGYFWRVTEGHAAGIWRVHPCIRVSLMKHTTRLRWFKRVPAVKEEEDYRFRRREDFQEWGVHSDIREMAQEIDREVRLDREISGYVGDYPPKKLGG